MHDEPRHHLSPAHCLVCGRAHTPYDAHVGYSARYHEQFARRFGRPATWADAVAHCDGLTRWLYRKVLERRREWSEPRHARPIAQEPLYGPPAPAAETVVA